MERTKARSSTDLASSGNQSAISTPNAPCFLNPTWSGKILEYGRVPPTTSRECLAKSGDFSGSGCGVSEKVLPAYLLRAGLGSKLSSWLTPPDRNTQMTLLALGGKCGLPSGGAQRGPSSARARPSRWSRAPRARPVNPMPTSARKVRRVGRNIGGPRRYAASGSADGHKVRMAEQDVDQVHAGPGVRVHIEQLGLEQLGLPFQKARCSLRFRGSRRPAEHMLEGRGHERLVGPVR